MTPLANALFVIGCFVVLFGKIWFLVEAFKQHILWGLCVLFIPFAALVFLMIHFRRAARPVLVLVVGIAIALTAVGLGASLVPGHSG
jgi:hypothetical protein